MKKQFIIYIFCAISSLNIGCFYSFTGASVNPNIKTVTINYFENKAKNINPSLSTTLTEKLKDIFSSQTNLSIKNNNGDLEFSADIMSYTILPVAIQSDQLANKNRMTISIKVKFTNIMEEGANFNTTFKRFRDFQSTANLSQIEEELISDICDELIEDIFNKAMVNW